VSNGEEGRVEGVWKELIDAVSAGERRALGRLITRVENREPGWQEAMKALYPRTGTARVVGITGPPGAGKSSLTNRIAAILLERERRVGIIAVDPTSPFSGGALLGDRLRMRDVSTASGIFIRSMATRGTLGGLCQGARDVARILEAAGHEMVLIETVGVGQDEIDVVKAADLVVVVCVPGQGDGIQTLKAGIMEIADLFADIRSMLALGGDRGVEPPPVLETCAITGEGVDALVSALVERADRVGASGERSETRIREEIFTLVERELARLVRWRFGTDSRLDAAVKSVQRGESDPYSAAEAVLQTIELAE
jgi:LAO/AO transport system kinase